MGTRLAETGSTISASGKPAEAVTAWMESFDEVIATLLPAELQSSARDLVRSLGMRVAVAEHFDAFCGQAFSKPDWAAAASPIIAEIFDQEEDLLAELARIPDLIIEMSSGQVTMTCMVASRWAARGETHRLSRLADSVVASHACKNVASVDVMLALAATLAVTRHSRAEQLYNAALPLSGAEHQEAIADAKQWLAAGRVVCSVSQDQRDFWDTRLRKPKTVWTWNSKEERHALDTLAGSLHINEDAEALFKAIVPPCWWDLAQRCTRQQEKLAAAAAQQEAGSRAAAPGAPFAFGDAPRAFDDGPRPHEHPVREYSPRPKASLIARFVLGWVCGAMAMAFTFVMLPANFVHWMLGTLPVPQVTTGQKEAWRKENLARLAQEMSGFSKIHEAAKTGTWSENERVLSGQTEELPLGSPNHLKMLAWLHLDPPADAEVRAHVAALLLRQVKTGTISLWEELIYPGSPNAEELRNAARDALADTALQWTDDERKRLEAIAAFKSVVAEQSQKSR